MKERYCHLGITALTLVLAGCGGSDGPPVEQRRDPVGRAVERAVEDPAGRVEPIQPRWVQIERIRTRGNEQRSVRIAPRAKQWRIRWRCRGYAAFEIRLNVIPRAPDTESASCPGIGSVTAVSTGRQRFAVRTTASWTADVDQQVVKAIHEPPPAAVVEGDARLVGRGPVYPVAQDGHGRALLYALPSGRLLVRLERFRTTASHGLRLWVTQNRRPQSSSAAARSPHLLIGKLRATAGDQNYLLPPGTDRSEAHGFVVWCPIVRIAYAAASLGPAPNGRR